MGQTLDRLETPIRARSNTGLTLAAVGGHASTVELISDTIADHVSDYIGMVGTPNFHVGRAAEAAVLAQTAGDDPKSYGGVNLVQTIESRVLTTAPSAGRLQELDSFPMGDNSPAGTRDQAFAARALAADSTATKAAVVTSYLLKQQCSSGYFRGYFTEAPDAPNQSCVNGTDAPDTEATAIVIQQLSGVTGNTPVTTAIAKAKAWLRAQQRCDGSFVGGTTEEFPVNSTGLVAWALGDTPASRQAAMWLRAHQATSADSGNSLAGQTGAIAYDNAALARGRAEGITDTNTGQWRHATLRAAPGIRWYSSDATPALSLTGTTGFVKAGSHPVLTSSGAARGTVLCVTGPSASTRGIAAAAPLKTAVTVPAGTATRVYTVKDPFGHADTQALKVLGRAQLAILRGKYRVKRSRTVTATVRYVAPGEWTRIYYKGRPVRSGKASATGTFSASFKVGRSKGSKTIAAYGLFTDIRRGATTIRVLR